MRSLRFAAVLAICLLGVSLASASHNKFGVADARSIQFDSPVRVGTVLLPAGEYRVLHTMEGQDHIMVFKQQNSKKPIETKVKCQLVPLSKAAPRTEKVYAVNDAKELVLHTLVFQGDTAQHVF
jgi:protein-disulfide isomerase